MVRYFGDSIQKWWPMRKLRPETGESLAIFQNTDPIVFVLFISFIFDLLYKRGYQK